MNVYRQCLKALITACVPREKLLTRGPVSADGRPALALTFDDGPHPVHTPRLLDRLDTFGLRATFFVIGRQAERHPELICRMIASGHEVANHTFTHSEPGETSATMLLEEIGETDALLASLTGRIPTSFRPPKGELTWTKLRGIWRSGKSVALWNVDPKDYRMSDSAEMARWCDTYQPRDGDVVLMHDIHPYAITAVETMAARGVFDQFRTSTIRDWLKVSPQPMLLAEGA